MREMRRRAMLEIKGKEKTALCFAKVIEDVAVEQQIMA